MVTVPEPRLEGSILLGDRRRIGYAEYGVPDGRPVLWFHGTPGARRQLPAEARIAAAERGVRLVMLERPGVGASTPHLYHSVVGWAADVGVCADRLGLGRFGVVGLSGGGPYVLACAHELRDRVVTAGVLSGVAPTRGRDAPPGGLTRLTAITHPILRRTHAFTATAMKVGLRTLTPLASPCFELYVAVSPAGDQRLFRMPGMKEMFLDDLLRGGRRNFGAVAADLVQFGREWGFSPRDIEVPVHFWYGDTDNIVPVEHGRHLAALVPGSDFRVRAGESHLGNLAAVDEVLDVLLADWPDGLDGPPLSRSSAP